MTWYSVTTPIRQGALGCLFGVCVLCGSVCDAGNWEEFADAKSNRTEVHPQVRDRFLKEAPISWESMKEEHVGFQVEVRTESIVKKGKETRKSSKMRVYSVNDDLRLQLAREINDNGGASVSISNERQSFVVKRDGPDYGYYLTEVKSSPQKTSDMVVVLSNLAGTLASAWSIWWIPLDELVRNSDFELVQATMDRTAEPRVATIVYRYRGKSGASVLWQPGAIYWAKCLPEESWLVTESGVTNFKEGGNPLVVRVTCSYQPWFKSGKIMKERLVEYYEPKKAEVTEVDHTTLDVPVAHDTPHEEFYLPYYGMDESSVVFAPRKSDSRTWLVFLTAGVCVLLAALVWRKHSRSSVFSDVIEN